MSARLSGESVTRRFRSTVTVASPAAGADWTATVPAGHRWTLISAHAQLVTSATVASRLPRLVFSDGATTYLRVPMPAIIAAGLTTLCSWAFGLTAGSPAGAFTAGLSPLELSRGEVISVSTAAIDATDQWSGIVLRVLDELIGNGPDLLSDLQGVDIEAISSALLGQ